MSKSIAAHHMAACVHFRGIQHATCEAGIDWSALTGGPDFGIATRIPCLRENNSAVLCTHRRFPTPEEAAAHERAMEEHIQRRMEDMALIASGHAGEPGISRFYVCELCDRAERFTARTPEELSTHATEAHGVAPSDILAATGAFMMHSDAQNWFQNDDHFTLPDGRPLLIRSVRRPRTGMSRAAWGDADERPRRKRTR